MATLSARSLATFLTGWRLSGAGAAYQSLADRVRLLVLDGRIPLGTRLPAERELAAALGVSRTTVSSAYAALRDSGHIESLRGSGSVARLPHPSATSAPEPADDLLDFSKATLPAIPGVAAYAERAVMKLPAFVGESGYDPYGVLALREQIAARYTRRGLPTSPDEVMVTIGAQHAISLVARAFVARGDRVLVESPSYPHAFEALRNAGGRLVQVAVTSEDGWDETALQQALQRTSPSLGYLMPDTHNPTGRRMPHDQRERLVATAARQGTRLVVDETMSEMQLDGSEAPTPFASLGGDLVITIGSVGKSVWGGLRIGWIRANRDDLQRIARIRFANDLGTPVLDQLIVAELMPDMDGILAGRRTQLREGRDLLAALLRRRLPTWRMPEVPGGLTAWVNLGAPISSQVALAARSEGLVIAAGPRFGIDGVFERFLRIPFSYPPEELERGVDALARAYAAISRNPIALGAEELAQIA
ncbi:PLP-dependent aminotransferase family protein [Schumannella luteola]|uniref:DNA-binding transcriptional MocR family regulator n=1 Tax=Schumannella luteola TaxID=472059 RepID=A0A852YF16_9MICO|nr:PLP-dependent aminotransferase family protein [Schumannella luteola]NYG98307.1 DNA-binding transcriptional MocR family regulator [Schumannella luteola]TPX05738.1 PLP-dependent aminotransferase family protein [Schumannella luteola]